MLLYVSASDRSSSGTRSKDRSKAGYKVAGDGPGYREIVVDEALWSGRAGGTRGPRRALNPNRPRRANGSGGSVTTRMTASGTVLKISGRICR